jgi:hypothetical protein
VVEARIGARRGGKRPGKKMEMKGDYHVHEKTFNIFEFST